MVYSPSSNANVQVCGYESSFVLRDTMSFHALHSVSCDCVTHEVVRYLKMSIEPFPNECEICPLFRSVEITIRSIPNTVVVDIYE